MSVWTRVWETVAIAIVYWGLARISQVVGIPPGNVSPIYPAAGFGIAMIVLRGDRVWLGIAAGQFLSNTVAFAQFEDPVLASLTLAVGLAVSAGATLQAMAVAFPLRRIDMARTPFEQVSHAFLFFATVVIACLISATIGVTALCFSPFANWSSVAYIWITWYVGDLTGALIVTPLFLLFPAAKRWWRQRDRMLEAAVIVLVLIALAMLVFSRWSFPSIANYPLAFLPIPLVIWGAIRFEGIGAIVLSLIVLLVAVPSTYAGYGPFETVDGNVSMLLLALYASVITGTGLLLAAALKERENSEQALRSATSSLIKTQFAVERAGDAIFILRPDSTFEYVNLQAAHLLQYSSEELTSMSVPDIDVNFPRETWPEFWENQIRRHSLRFDSTLRRNDGKLFPVEISVNHLELDGVERACAIVKDMTERKRAEEAVRHAERRLSQALTAGNIGLWDWDVSSNEVYYSATFKYQLGYGPDVEFDSYLDWETRLHPDDREEALKRIQDYFEGRDAEYKSTFRMRHRDGSYRWMLSRGAAYRDATGQPTRVIGVHVDVTEQRRRNEELERSNLELQQFAYAASHDLQEPLRSIGGFTQLLQRRITGQFDEETEEYLEAIVRSAKRMKGLLEDLLSYTRLDSRSRPFEPVPLADAVDDALSNLHTSIEDASAEISIEPLPTVFGDRTQLVQLFQNLIGNAIKFHGEERPVVKVHAEKRDTDWHLTVEDNGIGIDPKYHASIFEVFRRLHHRNEQPGNGIGLAICRRVVNRHRGNIWVESAPGSGSRFRFSLPVDHRELSQWEE